MPSEPPQLTVSRVFDASRALVFRAFTDPDHLARWWGPRGHSLPRDEISSDIRPGGFQHWTEVATADPDIRVHVHLDLSDVVDGELLAGVLRVSGRLPGDIEPFETPFRIEFHDEPDGRTRLEIRQWLPPSLTGPSNQGWREAFEKLDATLLDLQASDVKA